MTFNMEGNTNVEHEQLLPGEVQDRSDEPLSVQCPRCGNGTTRTIVSRSTILTVACSVIAAIISGSVVAWLVSGLGRQRDPSLSLYCMTFQQTRLRF